MQLDRGVEEVKEKVIVSGPESIVPFLRGYIYCPFENFEQEELWVLLLNNRNRITHQHMLYRGTVASAPCRTAELFRTAIRMNAASIIVAHNHPSKDAAPSDDDILCYQRMREAGDLLGIRVLDHIVLGDPGWTSLAEHSGHGNSDRANG